MIKQYLPLHITWSENSEKFISSPPRPHLFKNAEHATISTGLLNIFIITYAIAFNSPLRPVTAFVGDVIEAVYRAVAEIRPYSTHGGGTMIHFYYLPHLYRLIYPYYSNLLLV